MADENGIVVKPAIVKQDGNTTEIEIHIEKPAEPEAPKAPTQEELLTEILAVLKEQQAAAPTVGPTIIFEGKITFGGVEIYRV